MFVLDWLIRSAGRLVPYHRSWWRMFFLWWSFANAMVNFEIAGQGGAWSRLDDTPKIPRARSTVRQNHYIVLVLVNIITFVTIFKKHNPSNYPPPKISHLTILDRYYFTSIVFAIVHTTVTTVYRSNVNIWHLFCLFLLHIMF